MLKILIIDDEESACNILKILLEKHLPLEKEIRTCTSPSDALLLMEAFRPTLVLLDIEMPDMNGFDFLSKASAWEFDVIFTTAYDKYAIKAIRFSALDYLLKPIDLTELTNALNRHILKNNIETGQQGKLLNNLIHNLQQQDQQAFKLAIAVKEGLFFFELKDIICLEGFSNYTKFHFTHQKPLMVSKTIKDYEEILTGHDFFRVHKSYMINKLHVKKMDKDGMLWLSNNMQVSVSRRKKGDISNLFSM